MHFIGVSTQAITDGGTQKPIINGSEATPVNGDIVIYNNVEFIWNGSVWESFADVYPSLAGGLAQTNDTTVLGGVTVDGQAVTPTKKTLIGGGATSVTYEATDKIKISSTNTDTTYDLNATKSATNGNVKINLTAGGSGSGTDSVTIKGIGSTRVTTDANGDINIGEVYFGDAKGAPYTISGYLYNPSDHTLAASGENIISMYSTAYLGTTGTNTAKDADYYLYNTEIAPNNKDIIYIDPDWETPSSTEVVGTATIKGLTSYYTGLTVLVSGFSSWADPGCTFKLNINNLGAATI